MACIAYSMSGEGRGHAARALALARALAARGHRLVLLAPGEANALLEPVFRGSRVVVRPHQGMRHVYSGSGRLRFFATAFRALPFLVRMPGRVRRLARWLRAEGVDLVIADFEPLLPQAARRAGVPWVSVDHQHFLLVSQLVGLPLRQRLHAAAVRPLFWLVSPRPAAGVVSQFYRLPLKARFRDRFRQAGVFHRPGMGKLTPRDDGFLLVYCRRAADPAILGAIASAGLPLRCYGAGIDLPGVDCRAFHAEAFLRDLARCRALITTAGNQLIGEALALRKPVLALPEPGNFEQAINAHYLAASGAGVACPPERLTPGVVREFLDHPPAIRNHPLLDTADGLPEAVAIIERLLARTRS